MRSAIAVILAGGQGERLSVLSQQRAKPAVPFAGKYRIIDFTLSNCVNSGIYSVAVLTQYLPHSLNDHIGSGKPWDLDRMRGGVRLLQPYQGRDSGDWYRGTADAVYQNLPFLEDLRSDVMLVLSGDHIYKMDYRQMVQFHEERRADATVAVMEVPITEAHRFGTMITAPDGRVIEFDEKPKHPRSNLISMGVYVFERDLLARRLEEDAVLRTERDFGRNVIPRMVELDRVYAYRFQGYWQDVGTIRSYWESNLQLLDDPPPFNLYDPHWVIHTRSEERPPARLGEQARVIRSLISHGCIIDGTVERSVLSPGVVVERGAYVRDSILMTDTVVGRDARIERCILDKRVQVGAGAVLGVGDPSIPNQREPTRLDSGITVIGKGARVPPGIRVGCNVKIAPGVLESDFPGPEVPDGGTVEHAETSPVPARAR